MDIGVWACSSVVDGVASEWNVSQWRMLVGEVNEDERRAERGEGVAVICIPTRGEFKGI